MSKDWNIDLKKYENFLKNIDVDKYSYLREIKTVEHDFNSNLYPLEIYYKYYWETTNFKDYDEIFKIYWNAKLNPYIYEFIKKYYYGCSLNFVEEGFKARLYRTWMSILTQFHFQYLWNALFIEKIKSNAELDSMGIDAIVNISGKKIALQIKKLSYRREASERRFTKRQQKKADIMVEVPYIVVDLDDLEHKIISPRTKHKTKEDCRVLLKIFHKNFIKYDNGFIVFKEEYLTHIFETINQKLYQVDKGKISYNEILNCPI